MSVSACVFGERQAAPERANPITDAVYIPRRLLSGQAGRDGRGISINSERWGALEAARRHAAHGTAARERACPSPRRTIDSHGARDGIDSR